MLLTKMSGFFLLGAHIDNLKLEYVQDLIILAEVYSALAQHWHLETIESHIGQQPTQY